MLIRRDGVGAIEVEGVGRRPVARIVEVEGAARQVVRRPAVHRVGLLGGGAPVARRESREQRREDVAPLVVGRRVEGVAGRRGARRRAAARNDVGLGETAVLPQRDGALAGRVEVVLQRGLADQDVALGLAGRCRAEHEVGARRAPGAAAQRRARHGVGIVLAVVPDAAGVGLSVGHARNGHVAELRDGREILAPVGRRIEARAEIAVGRRDHHRRLAVERAVGRSRWRGGIGERRGRLEARQVRGQGGAADRVAARIAAAVGVVDVHREVLGEARDRREVALVRPLVLQRELELGVAVVPGFDVGLDVALVAADQGREIVVVAGSSLCTMR